MRDPIEERLDQIAESARSAELKNAIHACRPSHPWNKDAVRPWLNAYFMASPFESGVSVDDLAWLKRQAETDDRFD